MTAPTPQPAIPGRAEREARNTALIANGTETGFWNEDGRPARWPDDIDEWTYDTGRPGHEDGSNP